MNIKKFILTFFATIMLFVVVAVSIFFLNSHISNNSTNAILGSTQNVLNTTQKIGISDKKLLSAYVDSVDKNSVKFEAERLMELFYANDVTGGDVYYTCPSTDLNANTTGPHLYVCFMFTTVIKDALNNIKVVASNNKRNGQRDFNQGAPGPHIYIETSKDSKSTNYINDIKFLDNYWSSDSKKALKDAQNQNWSNAGEDFNKGNGGNYIKLMYKTVQVKQ